MTKLENILNDDYSYVELIDSMGNDLTIVNAARVSYGKQKEVLDIRDERLISYLIQHKHYSPLRGVVFQFRISAPIYVCRQWFKHAIASSYVDSQNQWNEQCISGDQVIKTWWGKSLSMREIHSRVSKNKAYKPTLRSMNSDGEIVKNKLKSIWSTGTQKVYRVTSELGFTIDSTLSHRYATPAGYKTLGELKVGDEVMMNGIPIYRNKAWLKERYVTRGMFIEDIAYEACCSYHTIRKWIKKFDLQQTRLEITRRTIEKHGVFGKGHTKETMPALAIRGKKVSAKTKGKPCYAKGEKHHTWKGSEATLNAGHYRARKTVEKNQCAFCETRDRLVVHHIDENPLNNDPGNLKVVCRKHHSLLHGEHAFLRAHPVKIASIEYIGEIDTYDIEMEGYPNFVANQFIVHNSLRYRTIKDFKYYIPTELRMQSKVNHQGSEGKLPPELNKEALRQYKQACELAFVNYHNLIGAGVAREQARGILPTSTYTEFIWTTSLQAVLNFIALRKGSGAQGEIYEYADAIACLVEKVVPVTYELFMLHKINKGVESNLF